MTLEELLAVAEIVEKLTNRYRDQEAAHKAALTEIRASFVARAGADEKLIEGRRMEIIRLNAANDRLNDLLRAERLARRDEVAALQERLRRITLVDDDGSEPCDPPQTERAHPVAVGGYLRRLTGFNSTPAGEVARVTLVDADDPSQVEYEVVRPNGQKGRWSAKGCEPCDPPKATPVMPKPGDMVRLVSRPERDNVDKNLRTALWWPWEDRWGVVGQTRKVVAGCRCIPGAVAVATDIYAHWPLSCVEVVAEATHDTEVGKAAAESAVRTDPMCVGDEVEVVGRSAPAPGSGMFTGTVAPIGTQGIATMIHGTAGFVELDNGTRASIKDVRKVTT